MISGLIPTGGALCGGTMIVAFEKGERKEWFEKEKGKRSSNGRKSSSSSSPQIHFQDTLRTDKWCSLKQTENEVIATSTTIAASLLFI